MRFKSKLQLITLLQICLIVLFSFQPGFSQANSDKPTIRFAILGDRTGSAQEGIFEQAVAEINRLRPDFVMTVGDMIEGYTNDTTVINQEWSEYQALIASFKCPVYFTPGNHDITFDGMESSYEKTIGQPFYSFDWQQLHFVILDNSRWDKIADFPAEQLKWLQNDLEKVSPDQKMWAAC